MIPKPLVVFTSLALAGATASPALAQTPAPASAPTPAPAPAPAPAPPTTAPAPTPTASPTPTPGASPTPTPAPPSHTLATEDVAGPADSSDLPFFPARRQLAPPADPPEPDGFVLAGAVGFQQLIVLEAESSGTIVSVGGYAGKRSFGFTFEYNNLAGVSGFSGGVSLGRFGNAVKIAGSGGYLVTLLGPTLDAKAKIFMMEDPMVIATATVDVLGLRFAKCTGSSSFHLSLRGPTIGAAAVFMSEARFEPNDEPLGAVVVGAMLEGGLAF
jgi:hypothetical protein